MTPEAGVTPAKRPRGRPRKVVLDDLAAAATPAPSLLAGVDAAGDALTRLEQRANAPAVDAARVGQALRESLEPYRQRAAAAIGRAARDHLAATRLLTRLSDLESRGEITRWALTLSAYSGRGSTLVLWLRAWAAKLRGVYETTLSADLTVPSVLTRLGRVAPRIDALGAEHLHNCPSYPPGCGCRVAQIRTTVEDGEGLVAEVPQLLATLVGQLEKIDAVLTLRGDDGGAVRYAAPPEQTGPGAELADVGATALAPAPEEEN